MAPNRKHAVFRTHSADYLDLAKGGDPSVQYPTPTEIESCLKIFANEIGETTDYPFRVDMVPRYGGKPPVYTVIIRAAEKEPLRCKLGEVLNRSFSLGGTSFALKASEAQVILQYRRKSG
jgi:hypothetical protein